MKLIGFAYCPEQGGHETYADWIKHLPMLAQESAVLQTSDGWLVKLFIAREVWPTIRLAGGVALIGEGAAYVRSMRTFRPAIGYAWAPDLSVEAVGFALLDDEHVRLMRDFVETTLHRSLYIQRN